MLHIKTPWQTVEDEARRLEGVGEEYSLHFASINYKKDGKEYVDYRLAKRIDKNAFEKLTGRIEDYSVIKPR